jgi:glycosyltransferase involved in cell wall biosynthesis
MGLTVVVLTRNEEKHIARCLESTRPFASHVLVVDCGSTDRTVEIARSMGAEVLEKPWVNYSTQLNWAIDQVPTESEWIMRLDADEVVTQSLSVEIAEHLPVLSRSINGVYVSRRMTFMGRPIRWGGLFPVRVLRIFRSGQGRCENRWMDEHIMVEGRTADFAGEILDDNLNSLTWWTDKHNAYASREVVDLLNLEYRFMPHESVADLKSLRQAGIKRWIKENVYTRLPSGVRALVYVLYRYILRLGFLDGREGMIFHVLQGFWYRFLVDAKRQEVLAYMRQNAVGPVLAIKEILGIDVRR